MIPESDIAGHLTAARKKLTELAPGLLRKHPAATYIREIKASREWQRYYYIGPKLRKMMEDILSIHGLHVMACYHKLALASLIQDSMNGLKKKHFPEAVEGYYREWFSRVMKDFARLPDEYYDAENFSFLQDLAVCGLRAIPVGGAWFVEISRAKEWTENQGRGEKGRDVPTRPSRMLLAKLNLRRFIVPLVYKWGFCELYYQVHTFARYMPRFTPEEMDKAYLAIAELLRKDRRIKGLFRRSWFLDPQLEKISPELVYLRKVPEQNGAEVFPCVTFQSAIDNALAFSPKRRKRHAEGKYTPACFAYVWPRKKLLEWEKKEAFSSPSVFLAKRKKGPGSSLSKP